MACSHRRTFNAIVRQTISYIASCMIYSLVTENAVHICFDSDLLLKQCSIDIFQTHTSWIEVHFHL